MLVTGSRCVALAVEAGAIAPKSRPRAAAHLSSLGHGRVCQKVLDVRGKQVHTPASQTRAALSAADLRCVVVCAGSMGPPGRGDQQREYSSATDELSPVSIQSLDHHPSGEDLWPGVEEESNFKQLMLQVKADPVLATSGLSEGFYYKVCIKI